ncbi:MAG: proteasome-type protease [Aquisalinus sp.]|nr:proteasome-type protease [Aquisalinus sp.]
MTYCVGLKLNDGLVMLADTRTNAGVDNISTYRKLFSWEVPGERAIVMMSSGNLSITQGVITRLNRAIHQAETDGTVETILNAETMFRVAQIVGDTMREVQGRHSAALEQRGAAADAMIMIGGQRKGGEHRLFLVYTAGNFIEATDDTGYFQIGDHKYGKPILDRVLEKSTPIPEAVKAALVSMDSTLRSNLSVGMPLDLAIIRTDTFELSHQKRIEADDQEFSKLSEAWSLALRNAFHGLPGNFDS